MIAAKFAILAADQLPEGKNKTSAKHLCAVLQEALSSDLYKYAESLAEFFQPILDEPWKLEDSPGPSAVSAPDSVLMN